MGHLDKVCAPLKDMGSGLMVKDECSLSMGRSATVGLIIDITFVF